MARGVKFSDGAIVCATVALMGAPSVLGDSLNHLVGQIFFFAGLLGFVVFVIWKIAGRSISPSSEEQLANSGAFAGRDNLGKQQVFHGAVTIHEAEDAKRDQEPKRRPFSFKPYLLREEWDVSEFATILSALDNDGVADLGAAQKYIDTLIDAMTHKNLKYIKKEMDFHPGSFFKPSRATKIKKADAVAWAESHGFNVDLLN